MGYRKQELIFGTAQRIISGDVSRLDSTAARKVSAAGGRVECRDKNQPQRVTGPISTGNKHYAARSAQNPGHDSDTGEILHSAGAHL